MKMPIIGIEKAEKEYGNFGFTIDYFYSFAVDGSALADDDDNG
jgi:hypothetical protein